ncbi:MAG: GIY-YIG nuclease family protein [Chitinophagales bacterium]|nr:GIY-YIG nuclease family protein [Chitinophagales bacterium]
MPDRQISPVEYGALAPGSQEWMCYYVYILWSEKLGKFYVGSTKDVENRLREHNKGESKFTSKGIPWVLVWQESVETNSEAVGLEMRIKKRGIKRFLEGFSGGSSAR